MFLVFIGVLGFLWDSGFFSFYCFYGFLRRVLGSVLGFFRVLGIRVFRVLRFLGFHGFEGF